MLRQVYIVLNDSVIYTRSFGKALTQEQYTGLYPEIKKDVYSKPADQITFYDYYKYKITHIAEPELGLIFIFVSGLTNDPIRLEEEIRRLKKEFVNVFGEIIQAGVDPSMIEVITPTVDAIHRNLRPKISLIGFSRVGKTTITKLIRAEEIPMEHVPTITGDVATIKIGKLHFHLWDFAGQEQFSFLWNKFIHGSDAVLLVTDSTLYNVEKSKFFLELIKDDAPHAHVAIIGNKQDLPDAMSVEDIERHLGLKTYSMIANNSDNRDKMMKIIADVLDISADISPLLKPIMDRDGLMLQAQDTLKKAANLFEQIADLYHDIGDDSLSHKFYEKSTKLKSYLEWLQNSVMVM